MSDTQHALIMEGGAMRGLFTCGVIDAFLEDGIVFDAAAGISAGAVFGVNYKSRQYGRALRYNLTFSRDPRYGSVISYLKTGDLFDTDFCYRVIPEELDVFDVEEFRANPMKFYIGAFDADTGEMVYRDCSEYTKEDALMMQASASMPVVSRPVEIEGRRLLDGGIADSIMYEYMEGLGYRRNVVVLTQPKGYEKKLSPLMPVMKKLLKKYPMVAKAMEERPAKYNRQVAELEAREARGETFVIRPPESLGISRAESDPRELQRVYFIGRNEALKKLPAMKEFLAK
jgi:predicted patatin/cPLA2 family phospholipase